MTVFEQQPVIGLFGTCGASTFRQDLFIPAYTELDISYFNPQVPNWTPDLAAEEADHMTYDVVQCWPITGETYGTGSLAETGYSVANSIRTASPLPKSILVMIDQELSSELDDPIARKESVRARQLVAEHLDHLDAPNVFMMPTLEAMLATSIVLHGVAKQIVEVSEAYAPSYRRYMQGRQEAVAYHSAMEQGLLGKDAAAISRALVPKTASE